MSKHIIRMKTGVMSRGVPTEGETSKQTKKNKKRNTTRAETERERERKRDKVSCEIGDWRVRPTSHKSMWYTKMSIFCVRKRKR